MGKCVCRPLPCKENKRKTTKKRSDFSSHTCQGLGLTSSRSFWYSFNCSLVNEYHSSTGYCLKNWANFSLKCSLASEFNFAFLWFIKRLLSCLLRGIIDLKSTTISFEKLRYFNSAGR